MTAVFAVSGVSKRYPGVQALTDVSIELRENEVLGLIGQNGSGKSTLLKLMSGAEQPDSGSLTLRGRTTTIRSPLAAAKIGIGMVHQEQSLIPNLTVAENIFLDKPTPNRRFGFYNWKSLYVEAEKQLAKIEADIAPDATVESLSFSARQMVEFAKVLAIEEMIDDHLVILFDEPTSLLSPREVDDLFRQIRRLKARSSIVFVSHRMDEVLEVSDRVHVMSNGLEVAERTRDTTTNAELYHLMVGEKQSDDYFYEEMRATADERPKRLEVSELTLAGVFSDVSFCVRSGEIVCLTGVGGSGAESVCRAIFGAEENVTGTIAIDGKAIAAGDRPTAAIARGVGYLPSERKTEGVLTGLTIADNIVLSFGPERAKGGLIDRDAEIRRATELTRKLKVKTPSIAEYVEKLSGGNQQKVALAKWLMSDDLRLLILDHPARGLDPGAKADLFLAMRELANRGIAILCVPDTLEETMGLADAIVVMRDGAITARFDDVASAKPEPERVVAAMV